MKAKKVVKRLAWSLELADEKVRRLERENAALGQALAHLLVYVDDDKYEEVEKSLTDEAFNGHEWASAAARALREQKAANDDVRDHLDEDDDE